MAEKVKIVGGDLDGSQLDNAASEATLLLIKDAMNKMANIQNVGARNANRDLLLLGGSARDTADDIGDLGGSFSMLGAPLKVLTGGFSMLVGGIGSLVGAVSTGANTLIKFSAGLIDSQPNITDFTEAIAESKLNILGLGTAIDAATKILYGNYTTFQDLAKSGFQLGGQVTELTRMVADNRLTMSEFSSIVTKNSENFASFGNATVGLNKFLKLNASAYRANNVELQKWGLTYADQGEIFADLLSKNSYGLKIGTRTQKDIVAISGEYATTLMKLSGITGKQLDQVQDEMKKQEMDSAFQMFLASLPIEQAAKISELVAKQGLQFGQDAADAAKAMAMGVAPMTEGSRIIAGVIPDYMSYTQRIIDSTKNSNEALEEFSDRTTKSNSAFAGNSARFLNGMRTTIFALNDSGSSMGTALNEFAGAAMRSSGALPPLADELDPVAKAIAAFNDSMSNLRASVAGWFTDFFTNPEVKAGFDKLAVWIKEFNPLDYNPFDTAGRQNIYNSFWKAVNAVSTTMSEWWNGKTGLELRNTISEFFAGLVNTISDMFVNSTALNTLLGIDREDVAYRQASSGGNIDVENALTAALGKGVFNTSELRGMESVGGKEAYDQLINQLGDTADDYWTVNGRIEAALETLGEKYKAGTATESERKLFADTIAKLTNTNATTGLPPIRRPLSNPNPVTGSKYATGTNGFENFGSGTQAVLHNSEAVIPRNTLAGDMLNKFFGNDWNKPTGIPQSQGSSQPSQENTGKYIIQLNSTMLMVLEELRKGNDLEKRTLNSVKSLSGDLYRGI